MPRHPRPSAAIGHPGPRRDGSGPPSPRAFTGPVLRRLAVIACLAGGLACAGREPAPGEPARRNKAERPPPFATAPEFSLLDGQARNHTLGSLMGPKGLVLVLYRGHW
jgi:hypothetical protein